MAAKIQCKICGDILESTYRHHFVACNCFKNDQSKGCYVDGGGDPYVRIGGEPKNILVYDYKEEKWKNLD